MSIPNKVIQRGYISGSRRESKEVTTFGTKVSFTKMVASGNDFIVLDQRQRRTKQRLKPLAKKICNRKYGIGADGLLILEKSRKADIRMRVFNPDGSEPQMCGNGLRCAALYSAGNQKRLKIQTRAGIMQAVVNKGSLEVKVKMSEPKDLRLDFPIKINKRMIKVNFINTGVPHVVIFAEGLDKINVINIARQIRFHKRFLPEGTNVNFVQIIDDDNIKLRTYERGVEEETLACGTGSVAAALLSVIFYSSLAKRGINVHTKGGEVLRVEFNKINGKFKDIWLQGKVRRVYSGVYYV